MRLVKEGRAHGWSIEMEIETNDEPLVNFSKHRTYMARRNTIKHKRTKIV